MQDTGSKKIKLVPVVPSSQLVQLVPSKTNRNTWQYAGYVLG